MGDSWFLQWKRFATCQPPIGSSKRKANRKLPRDSQTFAPPLALLISVQVAEVLASITDPRKMLGPEVLFSENSARDEAAKVRLLDRSVLLARSQNFANDYRFSISYMLDCEFVIKSDYLDLHYALLYILRPQVGAATSILLLRPLTALGR